MQALFSVIQSCLHKLGFEKIALNAGDGRAYYIAPQISKTGGFSRIGGFPEEIWLSISKIIWQNTLSEYIQGVSQTPETG